MFINVPFQSAAELSKLGAPKKVVDYIRKHHGYDTSHKMIIAKVLGREAYRLYAAVGNQWMDASLQDLDPEIMLVTEASTAAAVLGRKGGEKTSEAKTLANRAKANNPPKEGKLPRGRQLGSKNKPKDKDAN